eukprot:TRINITY_DN84_c0_g2_i1.p1 TRINITY_DN84_c0_g2~~TRINITY_DN84_c0_g2_i1.p1  ORF type:complete len:583 (-),score=168.08 TRINITY_DN84_c0_g2_i1:442-2190(-)
MEQGLLPGAPAASKCKQQCWVRWIIFAVCFLLMFYGFLSLGTKISDNEDKLDDLKAMYTQKKMALPENFHVIHPSPRRYQKSRGTCWDFGTVSCVEHQYRLQGYKKGFLSSDKNEWMPFSEQAYGVSIMEICADVKHPLYKKICQNPGDQVAYDSTEGGETQLLWAFKDFFENGGMLPEKIEGCDYQTWPGHDNEHKCDKMHEHQKNNPIRYKTKSFDTIYTIDEIKQRLFEKQYVMPWSSPVYGVNHYVPTETKNTDSVPCPIGEGFTTYWCDIVEDNMYNMDGEFFNYKRQMVLEAGHCMTTAGYTDTFKAKSGHKGGFIIRNSWDDGLVANDEFEKNKIKPRGSHSLYYFTGQISDADERVLCPSPHNPRNWYTCSSPKRNGELSDDYYTCTHNAKEEATIAFQPITLKCLNKSTLGLTCDVDDDNYEYTYFKHAGEQQAGDHLYTMRFLQAKKDKKTGDMTYALVKYEDKLVPLGEFAKVFTPIDAELAQLKNHDDFCGYYLFPFHVFEDMSIFGGAYVNDYEFEFHESSYAANKSKYPKYDYTLVENSKKIQEKFPEQLTVSQFPDPRVSDYFPKTK